MKKLILFSIFIGVSSHAANFFVRTNATGSATGADWSNAWSLQGITWASVTSGDTIYLAGGTYTNALAIGKSGTAGSRILIQRVRATDSAATNAAGWNANLDAQVFISNPVSNANVFIGIKWSDSAGDFVTVDGRITNGISLRVSDQTTPSDSWQSSICLWLNTSFTNVSLTNLEFSSVGGAGGFKFVGASTGIYVNGSNAKSGLSVAACSFHGMVQAVQVGTSLTDSTFEKCSFYDLFPLTPDADPLQHDNVIWGSGMTNIVFRFNRIWNWATEGLLLTSAGNGRWDIYGNVWYDGGGTSRIYEGQANNGPLYFYNNTCVNVPGFGLRVFSGTTDMKVTNNIFYSVGAVDPTTKDYNLYSGSTSEAHGIGSATSSVFADYAGKNFNIVTNIGAAYPRDKGVNLGSSYNVDFAGNTRSGTWDIGAYESDGTSGGGGGDTTAPTCAITSPASVSSGSSGSYSTSSSTITVSGTSDDATATVTWSNSRGGAGTATGSTSWSQAGITLASGGNVLTFIATDPSLNASTTTLNVTYTVPAAGGTTNNVGTLRIY